MLQVPFIASYVNVTGKQVIVRVTPPGRMKQVITKEPPIVSWGSGSPVVSSTTHSTYPISNRNTRDTGSQEGHINMVDFRPGSPFDGMQAFRPGPVHLSVISLTGASTDKLGAAPG